MELQESPVEREGKDEFALDTIPDSSSDGVKDWLKKLPGIFMASQILLILKASGRYQHIATNASAKDAEILVKTQEALFSILKVVDAVSLMLQSFQSGANNILEKLKVAYLYLLDGFPDFANTDIEAIAKDVNNMKASTEKAQAVVEQTEKQMQDILKFMSTTSGDEARTIEIEKEEGELIEQYRRLNEELINMGEAPTSSDDAVAISNRTLLDCILINIKAFFMDWISLLITGAGFVSFCACDCKFYNSICGWMILVLCFAVILLSWRSCTFVDFLLANAKAFFMVWISLLVAVGAVVSYGFTCGMFSTNCGKWMLAILFLAFILLYLSSWTSFDFYVNTKALCMDGICLLVTIGVFVSLYTCDDTFYNSVCGWLILTLCCVLLPCRFALMRLLRPKHTEYKPVLPILLVSIGLILYPCQLILPCETKCFGAIVGVPPAALVIMFICYSCSPDYRFFKVQDSNTGLPLYDDVKRRSREDIQKEMEITRNRLNFLATEKQLLKERGGNGGLAYCFVGKAFRDLRSISSIVQQLTGVVELWYKECKDVVEPSMARTIRKAEGVAAEDKEHYWNSVAFKKEVVGYYCRWRALQVYCERLRSEVREKRAEIESRYTENLFPKEAVEKAWNMAAKDTSDPEVEKLVRQHEERLREGKGHITSRLANGIRNGDDVSLDMPE